MTRAVQCSTGHVMCLMIYISITKRATVKVLLRGHENAKFISSTHAGFELTVTIMVNKLTSQPKLYPKLHNVLNQSVLLIKRVQAIISCDRLSSANQIAL